MCSTELGVPQVNGILLDIGVSSPQLDDATRGFSFRFDAPLDMRMDPGSGLSAAEWLATAAEGEISEVIRSYGEERFAKSIARAIVAARQVEAIRTTGQLASLIAATIKWREPGQHPATRSFQAIRIYLNRELEELSAVLPQCVDELIPGGQTRGHQLSFAGRSHRQALHARRGAGRTGASAFANSGCHAEAGPVEVGGACPARKAMRRRAANPRARSAVLRVAERMGGAA